MSHCIMSFAIYWLLRAFKVITIIFELIRGVIGNSGDFGVRS